MVTTMKSRAYQTLIKVLEESLGVVILEKENVDFAISDYIYDSIIFIQLIVALENELKIELPDDFLDFELLNSANGFAEKLDCFLKSGQNNM